MARAPVFQLIMTPSGVTPMIASRETSTIPCRYFNSPSTLSRFEHVRDQSLQRIAVSAICEITSKVKSTVHEEPIKVGCPAQRKIAIGIIAGGNTHAVRLIWESEGSLYGAIFLRFDP